jgi:hypothetical protein
MLALTTPLAARPRRVRAGVTIAVVACVGAGCASPEQRQPRSSQPLPDLSGLAWMGDDLLLAVHDAKNPEELDRPRVSLLSPPTSLDGVLWQPLEVAFPGAMSSDLESAARIPNTSRLLLVESGDNGSGSDRIFLGEFDGHLLSILGETRWSAFTEVWNVEATAVRAVSPTELLFVWGERNQGETGTDIRWAPLALEPFSIAAEAGRAWFELPASAFDASGAALYDRPLVALEIDSRGTVYAAATQDPEGSSPDPDNGPFRSVVYHIGEMRADGISLAREPLIVAILDGLKVESLAIDESGDVPALYIGTDDENYGGILRVLAMPGQHGD